MVKMRNEVYGTITLDVSIVTNENSEELAMLQAGYKVNDNNFSKEMLNKMKIHNVNVDWDKFFGDDE